ncbi:MAG: hypothetical protein K8H88_19065, partial [Sandaracinaceae bacterium]|nr:hypothetical protein [Sandaracinaceae bacterium]
VADEIEAAAKVLPADLAKPYVEAWQQSAKEDASTAQHAAKELTRAAAIVSFEGDALEPARAAEPTAPARQAAAPAAQQAIFRPSFPGIDQVDDSVTVSDPGVLGAMSEISSQEIASQDFEVRISGAPAPSAATSKPAPPGKPPREGPGALGWALRVFLVTVVAFAAGAGIAVLWVRLMQ